MKQLIRRPIYNQWTQVTTKRPISTYTYGTWQQVGAERATQMIDDVVGIFRPCLLQSAPVHLVPKSET